MLSTDTLFTIIVASYNNGRYLKQLFDSILNQTYTNWELVVVDDFSTDDSVAIISQYSKKDKRIKLFVHDQNLGVGAAFRTATLHSSGEVIGMLGADDALVPDAIEKMVKAHLENPNASLINSDSYHCDENLNIRGIYDAFSALPKGTHLIQNISICNFATFKKSAYDKTAGFDPDLRKAVDHDIFLKLDEFGSLYYIHEPLYLYRVHSGGVSQIKNGLRAAQSSIIARRNAYYRRLGSTKKNLSSKEFRDMMVTYYLRESYFYRHKDMKKCNQLLLKAVSEFSQIILKKEFWSILIRNNFTKA
jgi:glycosyltransferase involved in cell wall biosynthesis